MSTFSRHTIMGTLGVGGLQPAANTSAVGEQKRYGLRTKRAPLSSIGNQGVVKSGKAHKATELMSPSGAQFSNEDLTMHDPTVTSVVRPAMVKDIDGEKDPQLVGDYAPEIHSYMLKREVALACNPGYMATQEHINEKMRGVLVDWLVEVHLRFELLPETLMLTTALIDRYLSKAQVSKSKLQLVGVTGMLIASKYEEMWPPEIQDFVYMTDNAYDKAQIIEMEGKMLNTLEYNLGNPLPTTFLQRYSRAVDGDAATNAIATYAMELTLSNYKMISTKPSMLAASALVIARAVQGVHTWSESLRFYSGYTKAQLEPTIAGINAALKAAAADGATLKAVKKKHAKTKFQATSSRQDIAAYVRGL